MVSKASDRGPLPSCHRLGALKPALANPFPYLIILALFRQLQTKDRGITVIRSYHHSPARTQPGGRNRTGDMASVASSSLHQMHLSSIFLRKSDNSSGMHSSSVILLAHEFHRISVVRKRGRRMQAAASDTGSRETNSRKATDSRLLGETGVGFSSMRFVDQRLERKAKKNVVIIGLTTSRAKAEGGFSSLRSEDGSSRRKLKGIFDKSVPSKINREMSSQFSSWKSRSDGVKRTSVNNEGGPGASGGERSCMQVAAHNLYLRTGDQTMKSKKNGWRRAPVGNLERKLRRRKHQAQTEESRREIGDEVPSHEFEDEESGIKSKNNSSVVDEKNEQRFWKQKRALRSTESRSHVRTERESSLARPTHGSEEADEKSKKPRSGSKVKKRNNKKAKRSQDDSREIQLRSWLDTCSKKGDVMGAIWAYDFALNKGLKLEQYHYNVLLYLCSSAALGVVQPAKSGTSRTSDKVGLANKLSDETLLDSRENGIAHAAKIDSMKLDSLVSNGLLAESSGKYIKIFGAMGKNSGFLSNGPLRLGNSSCHPSEKLEFNPSGSRVDSSKYDGGVNVKREGSDFQFSRGDACDETINVLNQDRMKYPYETLGDSQNENDLSDNGHENGIRVSDDIKKYALTKGFEIYERMCSEKIPLSEAALTSVARMSMSTGNGDMAFEMVKQMNPLGINPRLRSYGPALLTFCNKGEIEKAFEVEKHMLECGVHPEEPELEALLRVSVRAGRADKVYYLFHKLRTSTRQVSPSTADLIEKWFKSLAASKVGKRKWDQRLILQAMANGGGGWHGMGWLGSGKWIIAHAAVMADGVCSGCGEQLATIDLDPIETENFAKSLAAIARKRERNASFQTFQKWLDYCGPFEAVVDAANVGLFTHRRFSLSKVNTVVNGIRQKLPSKKWPLIVVHNMRISGGRMDKTRNKLLIGKWKNADALYATPTGSNDDWYWLYAAVKFKCLIVTNDEMRDHTFQLLGNDFFPRWKEKHQVRFSFHKGSPEFHMPTPYSVVIQESDKGHWHIPIVAGPDSETERAWLCVTRGTLPTKIQDSSTKLTEKHPKYEKESAITDAHISNTVRLSPTDRCSGDMSNQNTLYPSQKIYHEATHDHSAYHTIISKIEAAEKLAGCVIDFQI